jgi:DNA sulfur modification protein DndB
MKTISVPYISLTQGANQLLLTKLAASVLVRITYVASRGISDEQGAVQRILNSSRISSIRDYTLDGGMYPNAIILNWMSGTESIGFQDGFLTLPIVSRAAQIIDGQHRVAGIEVAMKDDESIGALEIPAVIFMELTTQKCADIFLSINTEQKPVPRSLVYDLYGIATEQTVDAAVLRARDIAMTLQESEDSPYYGELKFPGTPRRKGGIALSTAVSAIKPLVEEKSIFEQIGIKELETQKRIVLNYFMVLRDKYGDAWYEQKNAFNYAAGFIAALEFLHHRLIQYCQSKKSFTTSTMGTALQLDRTNLILQHEVRGLGGKEAPRLIFDRLVDSFNPDVEHHRDIEL